MEQIPLVVPGFLKRNGVPIGSLGHIEKALDQNLSDTLQAALGLLNLSTHRIAYSGPLPSGMTLSTYNTGSQGFYVVVKNPPSNLTLFDYSEVAIPENLQHYHGFIDHLSNNCYLDLKTILYHPILGYGSIQGVIGGEGTIVQILTVFTASHQKLDAHSYAVFFVQKEFVNLDSLADLFMSRVEEPLALLTVNREHPNVTYIIT